MLQQYIIQHLNLRVYKTRVHLHDSIDSQRTSENTFSSVKTLSATKTHKYVTKTHKLGLTRLSWKLYTLKNNFAPQGDDFSTLAFQINENIRLSHQEIPLRHQV